MDVIMLPKRVIEAIASCSNSIFFLGSVLPDKTPSAMEACTMWALQWNKTTSKLKKIKEEGFQYKCLSIISLPWLYKQKDKEHSFSVYKSHWKWRIRNKYWRIEKIIAHSILSRQPFTRNMHNNLHYYGKWLQHTAFVLCNCFFEIELWYGTMTSNAN